MKILHTSDWHLGKKLFRLDRTEEHKLFLKWLLDQLIIQQIDVLFIAGDIFDTPTPPHQAQEMLYDFLYEVSVKTKTTTFIIAGNHDSGHLLEAPAKILKNHRVKIWGKLSENPTDHWITFTHEKESINICGIPFFRSYELMPQGESDAIIALQKYLETPKSGKNFLLFHHLVGIFEAAGSEQAISLTGLESIPKDLLNKFDYVALGHIHKPQKVATNAYYSGSPIPLRFSETFAKNVVIIDVTDSNIEISHTSIPIFRQIIQLKVDESNWEEKVNGLIKETELTPVVEIQMKLKAPVVGLVDKIRNILDKKSMDLLLFEPLFQDENKPQKNEKLFELNTFELFKEFYKHKYPESEKMPPELEEDFKELVLRVSHETPQTET